MFAMVSIVACGGASDPSSVAVKFTECQFNEDIDGMLDLVDLTDEKRAEFKAMYKEKASDDFAKRLDEVGGFKGAKALSEDIAEDGSKATVKVEITLGDGTTDASDIYLVNVDGKWFIKSPMR